MLYHQEAVVRPQNSFQSRMEQSLLCRYMKYFDSLGATAVAEWVAAAMTEWVATVVAAIELVVMAAGVCVCCCGGAGDCNCGCNCVYGCGEAGKNSKSITYYKLGEKK